MRRTLSPLVPHWKKTMCVCVLKGDITFDRTNDIGLTGDKRADRDIYTRARARYNFMD